MSKHEEMKVEQRLLKQMSGLDRKKIVQRCNCYIAARGDQAKDLEQQIKEIHLELNVLNKIKRDKSI